MFRAASSRHYQGTLLFPTLGLSGRCLSVLLRRRFENPVYYTHFVSHVRLLHLCLQFKISTADINTIEDGMAAWVQEFEKCGLVINNPSILYTILNENGETTGSYGILAVNLFVDSGV